MMRHNLFKCVVVLLCYALSAPMASATLLHATGSWTTETTDNALLPGPYGGTFSFFVELTDPGDNALQSWEAPLTTFTWVGDNYGGFNRTNVSASGGAQFGNPFGPVYIHSPFQDVYVTDGFSMPVFDGPIEPWHGSYWREGWDAPANGINEVGTLQWAEVTNFIYVDVNPGKDPNIINLKSHGFITVAVLTEAEFDALQLNPETARLGSLAARYRVKDVDKDGDVDLILYFRNQQTGIRCGDTQTTLTGELYDGTPVAGIGSFQTKNCSVSAE